jgi:hypothetical protein
VDCKYCKASWTTFELSTIFAGDIARQSSTPTVLTFAQEKPGNTLAAMTTAPVATPKRRNSLRLTAIPSVIEYLPIVWVKRHPEAKVYSLVRSHDQGN